jgi:Protein of unknown function (DUF2846)
MQINKINACLVVLSVLLLGGCASVQMASDADDLAAKKFVTKPDVGRLYVYRNESMGAAIKMPVSIDGQIVGETASKTYLMFDLKPGAHVIRSHTENTPELSINAAAGKLYFVWQEVKMGMWQAGSALHLVDQLQGRDGVFECKLATAGVGSK